MPRATIIVPVALLALLQQAAATVEIPVGNNNCISALVQNPMTVPKTGTVVSVRIVYRSGGLTCPGVDLPGQRWGCSTDLNTMDIAIRDSTNQQNLAPTALTTGYAKVGPNEEYTLNGYTVNSDEVIFNGPSYRVNANTEIFLNFANSVQYDGQVCADVFLTYADDPSMSESESLSQSESASQMASESESQSESESESQSESTSESESVSSSEIASASHSEMASDSESQSESQSPLGGGLPSESESGSESESPSTSELLLPSPSASESEVPSHSQSISASRSTSGSTSARASHSPVASGSPSISESPILSASNSGDNFSILPTSRRRTPSRSPSNGVLADSRARTPSRSIRPSRSPPKRRSASPARNSPARNSPARYSTKASPARKPSPAQPIRNPSPSRRSGGGSGGNDNGKDGRAQVSPKNRKHHDDAPVIDSPSARPAPLNAAYYAATVSNADAAAEAITAPAESSNSALYGLLAIIPVVGAAAFAVWRYGRKTPEAVDFDMQEDNTLANDGGYECNGVEICPSANA